MKELALPSDFFNNANEVVVGTTLIVAGTKAPFPVRWRSLTSNAGGTVTPDGCPKSASFAYLDQNGSYPPGDAALVCQGTTNSELVLIRAPNLTVLTFPLPGRPASASEYFLNAFSFGWPTDPQILWSVQQSEEPAPLLGSGLLNLNTGQDLPPPKALNTDLRVSPNGTLYALNGNTLAKWDGSAFESLGTITRPRAEAVSDNGVVWSDEPSTSNVWTDTLVRQTVNSSAQQSWTIHGAIALFGPGFVAWTPGTSLSGPPLKIFFPEALRTLTLRNVWGQPIEDGFEVSNYEVITHTNSGGAVIEVLPP